MAEAQPTGLAKVPTVFDSGQYYLGGVYAKALLGATEKAGVTAQAMSEFDSLIHDVFDKLPKLEALLSSARIDHEVKDGILLKTFQGKMCPQLLTFLRVISRHVRFNCIRAIHKCAWQQWNELRGRVVANVRTAVELTPELARDIAAKLQAALGKEVELKTTIDPSVIGGLVVRIGDTVFDGSLAHQLVRLRDETLRRTSQDIRGRLDRYAVT